jgi:hypothetical protein
MTPVQIFALTLIILAVLFIAYYIYRQIIWSRVNRHYEFARFKEANDEIDKLYSRTFLSIRKKMDVYKASCLLLLGDYDNFLIQIKKIKKTSLKYGVYYYYYMIAYLIIKEDFKQAEILYGELAKKFRVDRELDLVTPLAILLSEKGDKKAFKKLKELKRNRHIDITFLAVANDYIRKHKNDERFN